MLTIFLFLYKTFVDYYTFFASLDIIISHFLPKGLSTESTSCHTRQARGPHENERIRNFMKLKRQKAKSELKANREKSEQYRNNVQKRLLALEVKRRSKVRSKFAQNRKTLKRVCGHAV